MTVTNHSTLVQMKWGQIRWDEWYERLFDCLMSVGTFCYWSLYHICMIFLCTLFQVILGFLLALKQFSIVNILDDHLFTGLQKNAVVVEERKPSSTSTDGNWSCNAGDSVMEWKAAKMTAKDQSSSATAPRKEPCSAVHDCDFDFKIPQPCGACI